MRAPGTGAGLWMWRQKRGVTPSSGAVRDRADDSRPEGQGKQVFVVINFTQETQHVALPHQMRALLSGVWESAFELPYDGIEALLAHD
jgi:hypothetical protein